MIFNVGDIIKWDAKAAKVKTKENKEQYGYITRIDEYVVYVRWFDLDYDQPFIHSTAKRVFNST
jgi:hypothetical protein